MGPVKNRYRRRFAASKKPSVNGFGGHVIQYHPGKHRGKLRRMPTKRDKAVKESLERAAALCAKHGVTLTELRTTVLKLVLEAPGPLTAYQLLDKLKETRKSAVPPTIYRSLDFLTENGLIHKVERLNAFVPCVDHDHGQHAVQFLICGTCGTVAEIEDDAIAKALAKAADRKGFKSSHAIVELDGICASCSD